MRKIYEVAQIRELERLAIASGINEGILMQRAGEALFKCFIQEWPSVKKVAVVCGSGNNGGDGYVFAKIAHQNNIDVKIYHVGDILQLPVVAAKMAKECRALDIPIEKISPTTKISAEVIVDALCGIGLSGFVHIETLKAIQLINQSNAEVLSVDVPSGVNAQTGSIEAEAVVAKVTMTFIAHKLGLLTGPALSCIGKLYCDDLGLPQTLMEKVGSKAVEIPLADCFHHFKRRERNCHKRQFGHVLIIGGDYGFRGAAQMAAQAAYRVGSGMVSVATRPELAPLFSIASPEIMARGISEIDDITEMLERASVVAIGPGLGKTKWARDLFSRVLESDLPKVIDADGLNLLAENPQQCDNWILTPHPAEAARLLGIETKVVQDDRVKALEALVDKYDGVAVLKGAGTLVGTKLNVRLCSAGNPGMATAGMGDILTGAIAGLLGQGLKSEIATLIGVLMHSTSADIIVAENGERGLMATDLLPQLHRLANTR